MAHPARSAHQLEGSGHQATLVPVEISGRGQQGGSSSDLRV